MIEEQSLGSKKDSKEQGAPEQIPERSYVGYYEGTIGLFEKLVMVISSKKEGVEGLEVPSTWPPSLVYGITPSASLDDDKHQQINLEGQLKSEDQGVDVSLAEFTETILNDSIVQVTPIVRSDDTKGRVQTSLEKGGFAIPTAESTCEKELRLTPSYEKRKDRETNQYQVSKEILSETVDEEAQLISVEVQKAMEEKYKAEQEAIQLRLQQEKLQREQEELVRKQAEELLAKEQQQRIELEKEKALLEEQQRKTQELKDKLTPEDIENREKIELDLQKARIREKDVQQEFCKWLASAESIQALGTIISCILRLKLLKEVSNITTFGGAILLIPVTPPATVLVADGPTIPGGPCSPCGPLGPCGPIKPS